MFLKNILENFPIYTTIVKYLSEKDINTLCNTYPELEEIFNMYGYKKKIKIYNNTVDRYIDCLHEFETHKRCIKEISAYDISTPFAFLPKRENIVYNLYRCENICRVPKYVKKLKIYTHKNINLYKLGLVCPDVEELYIDCYNLYSNIKKFTFKNLKKITITSILDDSILELIPQDIININ